MKLFLFLSDADSDFHGVDFLPDDLSDVPDETGMRVNKKYSCLPAEEKGIHIINIRAIEDIGYDQHESTVSKGLARYAAAGTLCFFPYLIPKCSLSLEALSSPSLSRVQRRLLPATAPACLVGLVLGCVGWQRETRDPFFNS